jgi:hypothetical protein
MIRPSACDCERSYYELLFVPLWQLAPNNIEHRHRDLNKSEKSSLFEEIINNRKRTGNRRSVLGFKEINFMQQTKWSKYLKKFLIFNLQRDRNVSMKKKRFEENFPFYLTSCEMWDTKSVDASVGVLKVIISFPSVKIKKVRRFGNP